MNKKILFTALIGFVLIIAVSSYITNNQPATPNNLTGELATLSANPGADIRTIAICNESNFCQDYKITCNNGQEINREPIESATVQHPEDWIDSRNIDYDNLCE